MAAIKMLCNECGKTFLAYIGLKTVEVKCPHCGGYDTEPA
jgi:DNA-directed RNA polymerase subunit RPC12/RpoP